MSFNSYSSSSVRLNTFAEAKALARAMPIECLTRFGLAKDMPKNSTDNITFRRVNPFPIASVLTEGVVPSSRTAVRTNVSVTVAKYGDLVRFSDKEYELSPEACVTDYSELCGDQQVETRESIVWQAIRAGTSVSYANGAARTAVNTVVTADKLNACIRLLEAARTPKVTKKVSTDDSFNTVNVRPGFIAFCHTDCKRDIQAITGFLDAKDYGGGSSEKVHDNEFGAFNEIRFVTCPHFDFFASGGGAKGSMKSTDGTSADVYSIVIIGEEAYGHVTVRGLKGKMSVILPTQTDSGNPLGQFGSVGWTGYFAAIRLNEQRLTRLEVAVTAL